MNQSNFPRCCLMIVLSLFILSPLNLFAGEPGQCTFVVDYSLPTVTGWLNFKKILDTEGNETGEGIATFSGFCKGQEVVKKFCFPILVAGGFAAIEKSHLENMPPFSDMGPPECASDCGREPMVITKVRLFHNNGKTINARVALNFGYEDCGNAALTTTTPKKLQK